MQIVYAGEEMPKTITKSLFLAGPTPRNRDEVESWRPIAIDILRDKGYTGTVFVPELRNPKEGHDYDDQVEWEEKYLNVADCIVFWVPRDIEPDSKGYPKMAAFTTNVEWGVWCDSGKVVFGAPKDADKIGYLEYYAKKYNVDISDTLTDTLQDAMDMIEDGAERQGGERFVPLLVWNTDSFQSWYGNLKEAGNRLDSAKLLFTFRPGMKDFVFLWVLKVDVYVASEDRHKTNEFVLARTDISSVLLYSCVEHSQGDGLVDYEVVLVKEFRSPASTTDGFIRELPGGSSIKAGVKPTETAAEEVHEETGFHLDPERLSSLGARQLAATLSSHKSFLFKVLLEPEEMKWFKSQEGTVHGNQDDSERTFIEVHNVLNLVHDKDLKLDWATLGMILSVVAS